MYHRFYGYDSLNNHKTYDSREDAIKDFKKRSNKEYQEGECPIIGNNFQVIGVYKKDGYHDCLLEHTTDDELVVRHFSVDNDDKVTFYGTQHEWDIFLQQLVGDVIPQHLYGHEWKRGTKRFFQGRYETLTYGDYRQTTMGSCIKVSDIVDEVEARFNVKPEFQQVDPNVKPLIGKHVTAVGYWDSYGCDLTIFLYKSDTRKKLHYHVIYVHGYDVGDDYVDDAEYRCMVTVDEWHEMTDGLCSRE